VGITAACIPCLRGPFIRLLGRLGISTEFSSGTTGNRSAWKSQSQPTGDKNSRPVGIYGHTERRGFSGSRAAAAKHTENNSEEDILTPGGKGRSARNDQIEVKTDIDIELASRDNLISWALKTGRGKGMALQMSFCFGI
jgi:hypothetical protein